MITEAVAAQRRMESLSLTPAVRRDLYEQMVLTRVFETEAERQYKAARIGGYCHLSSGQEATTTGVVHALRHDDRSSPATAVTASRWRAACRRRR